jgi:signal peptidase I
MSFLSAAILFPFHRIGRYFSGAGKVRRAADNWLELAEKVRHYRRDRLADAERAELDQREDELRRDLRENADAGKLRLDIEALEDVLRRCGGAVYPKSSLAENVDFFLVAAIVILGIRTYFLQPFKIPTNSMWPTYYGMTPEVFPPGTPAPGPLAQVFRFVAFGAQRRTAVAPRTGQVSAQYFLIGDRLSPGRVYLAYTVKTGRKWLFLPTEVHEYTFLVDGVPATVQVPADFDGFEAVVMQTFFGTEANFFRHVLEVQKAHPLETSLFKLGEAGDGYGRVVTIPLGRTVAAGQPIVRFDVMTGDQLFVDRLTYHFMRPKVGQGFVFRTGNIPAIGKDDYFIKHLVGLPGDVMEVRAPVLYRNGAPITGADAFGLNARRVAPYTGYTYGDSIAGGRYLAKGQTVTVPPNSFFAMGDNSSNSSDSRVWGFVPAADVVGRPLFVYYPFTRRWGWGR